MRRLIFSIVLITPFLFSSPGQGADYLHDQLEEMRKLDKKIVESREKAPLFERMLSEMLASVRKDTKLLADEELRDLYDAASVTVFYSRSRHAAETMQRMLQELERRKIAPAASGDDVMAALLAARMFGEALVYYQMHRGEVAHEPPLFEDLSSIRTRPSYLEVSSDGSVLKRREFVMKETAQVLVLGAPGCHFSRLATQAIEDDSQLATLMKQHATWLMSQQIVRNFQSIASWNRDHPLTQFGLIYSNEEWDFITSSSTPTFYFFNNGKLVESFSGWPGAQQKQRIISALGAIGIDTSAPPAPR